MSRTTPPPADTITILASDLMAHHASELLRQLAYAGKWDAADRLKAAVELYGECRIGTTMAEGAAEILRRIEEKTPDTLRTGAEP